MCTCIPLSLVDVVDVVDVAIDAMATTLRKQGVVIKLSAHDLFLFHVVQFISLRVLCGNQYRRFRGHAVRHGWSRLILVRWQKSKTVTFLRPTCTYGL